MKIKTIVDILMSLTLLFLMGFQFWGHSNHEIAGAVMMGLFLAHNGLNYKFYKAIFKGKYSFIRVFRLLTIILLFVAMLVTMASGIVLSTYVFSFFNISGGGFYARLAHMCGSYWSFVLTGVHLGFHFGVMSKSLKTKVNKVLLNIIYLGIIALGIYSFIKRRIFDFLFLRTMFPFMDTSESKVIFYVEYIGICLMFTIITHYILQAVINKSIKRVRG